MTRVFLFLGCICLMFQAAYAFDRADAGTYIVVDQNGQITPRAFRVSVGTSGWKMEKRESDGSWSGVSCSDEDCPLKASSATDLGRFFGTAVAGMIKPECRHNKALAFCSFSPFPNDKSRGYVFIWLVLEARPIPIRVIRLAGTDLMPVAQIDAAKKTYANSCSMCHDTGAAGAPRLGRQKEWAPRLQQTAEVLYLHAKDGFKACPPRGGFPTLTDAELRNVVNYIASHVEYR